MTTQLLAPSTSSSFVPAAGDPTVLRSAFSRFPSGVAALSAVVDETMTGMVASSFTVGISMDPPLVMFAAQNSSTTWPVLRQSARIGVSILGDGHADICYQLASRRGDRFAGLQTLRTPDGALFIGGSSLWLDCEIFDEIAAGDHSVVLLRVMSLQMDPGQEPLVFHGSKMRRLVA
jgi:flavin reductase (DIM6/NTAB) family NADH-FMN oxidoreductase RutF